jgi:hypothetical protein
VYHSGYYIISHTHDTLTHTHTYITTENIIHLALQAAKAKLEEALKQQEAGQKEGGGGGGGEGGGCPPPPFKNAADLIRTLTSRPRAPQKQVIGTTTTI